MRKIYMLAAALAGIAIALIIAQFSLTAEQRYDKQTESDLLIIRDAVESKYANTKVIEEDISKLELKQKLVERAGQRKYKVRVVNAPDISSRSILDIELCAEFKTDTSELYSYPTVKKHAAGFYCTEESIYLDIY